MNNRDLKRPGNLVKEHVIYNVTLAAFLNQNPVC